MFFAASLNISTDCIKHELVLTYLISKKYYFAFYLEMEVCVCMCNVCVQSRWYSATSVSVCGGGMDLFHSKRLIISRVLNKDNEKTVGINFNVLWSNAPCAQRQRALFDIF